MSHPMSLPPVQPVQPESFPRLEPGVKPAPPEPFVVSRTLEGYKYELQVLQQPIRARMCGFGDKVSSTTVCMLEFDTYNSLGSPSDYTTTVYSTGYH